MSSLPTRSMSNIVGGSNDPHTHSSTSTTSSSSASSASTLTSSSTGITSGDAAFIVDHARIEKLRTEKPWDKE